MSRNQSLLRKYIPLFATILLISLLSGCRDKVVSVEDGDNASIREVPNFTSTSPQITLNPQQISKIKSDSLWERYTTVLNRLAVEVQGAVSAMSTSDVEKIQNYLKSGRSIDGDLMAPISLSAPQVDILVSTASDLVTEYPELNTLRYPDINITPSEICIPGQIDGNCYPGPGDGGGGDGTGGGDEDDGGDDEGCSPDYGPCVAEAQAITAANLALAAYWRNVCIDECDQWEIPGTSEYTQCVWECNAEYHDNVQLAIALYIIMQANCYHDHC